MTLFFRLATLIEKPLITLYIEHIHCMFTFIYVHYYKRIGGGRSVMVIVIRNGIDDPSSSPK